MVVFPIRIEHPLDVTIQRPHDANPRNIVGRESVWGERFIFYDCPAITMICITTAKLLRPCTITVSQVELKR